jgi:hypothetical protein
VSGSEQRPRFLADENLESAIVQGVRLQRPEITLLTAKEAETLSLDDRQVLSQAQALDLILISHDSRTMYNHFAAFLMSLAPDEHSPGVLLVSQERYSIGQIISFIVEVYDLSSHQEWANRIVRLPL